MGHFHDDPGVENFAVCGVDTNTDFDGLDITRVLLPRIISAENGVGGIT
jgi:hypothetical protein